MRDAIRWYVSGFLTALVIVACWPMQQLEDEPVEEDDPAAARMMLDALPGHTKRLNEEITPALRRIVIRERSSAYRIGRSAP